MISHFTISSSGPYLQMIYLTWVTNSRYFTFFGHKSREEDILELIVQKVHRRHQQTFGGRGRHRVARSGDHERVAALVVHVSRAGSSFDVFFLHFDFNRKRYLTFGELLNSKNFIRKRFLRF